MPSLLIDTSTSSAFLALAQGGEILASCELTDMKKLSSTLLPSLRVLLKEQSITLQELDSIAVGIGPGSYMGIRTAASIAQTLSFGLHIPLLEFFSPLSFLPQTDGSFAYVGDAKMDKLFVLSGIKTGFSLELDDGPVLIEKEKLSPYIQNKDYILGHAGIKPQLNLTWLACYLERLFLEGKSTTNFNLNLAYLH